MPNKTYNDHTAATLPRDRSAFIPGWYQSGAKKFPIDEFVRFLMNPAPVTAGGNDQPGATALLDTHHYHFVGAVPSGGGVRLAAQASGILGEPRLIRVSRNAADDCRLYPPSGGQINEEATNAPVIIRRDQSVLIYSVSTTNWVTVP